MNWKNITGSDVYINSDITKSEVVFDLPINANQHHSTPNGTENGTDGTETPINEKVLALIKSNETITIQDIVNVTGASKRTKNRIISLLKEQNKLKRLGSARNGKWVLS